MDQNDAKCMNCVWRQYANELSKTAMLCCLPCVACCSFWPDGDGTGLAAGWHLEILVLMTNMVEGGWCEVWAVILLTALFIIISLPRRAGPDRSKTRPEVEDVISGRRTWLQAIISLSTHLYCLHQNIARSLEWIIFNTRHTTPGSRDSMKVTQIL